ncbi:MAG TPA: hypothetical protein VKV74_00470 [Bryobacteraceae bacterium]|nr:hypothetical protein [Bryobacteraceae bacterium]
MGCCGQQRAALAYGGAAGVQRPGEAGAAGGVKVEFTKRKAIVFRGPVTNRRYQFHEGAYVQTVDGRDAASLIKTGAFRLA